LRGQHGNAGPPQHDRRGGSRRASR
jgi:hypothetical protein